MKTARLSSSLPLETNLPCSTRGKLIDTQVCDITAGHYINLIVTSVTRKELADFEAKKPENVNGNDPY